VSALPAFLFFLAAHSRLPLVFLSFLAGHRQSMLIDVDTIPASERL